MAPLPTGAIRLRNVSRSFRIVHERNQTLKETVLRRRRSRFTELWALRDVGLDIEPGESVGIVGANGSGKSTLLKLVAGILHPQTGTVEVAGSVASMLELGAGFHPDFTGRENVYMNGSIHGLSKRDIDQRFERIVAFAELDEFIDMPVKTYSSGMQMRLAFAVASHVNPDILLVDEVLAVGDEAFQRKCFGRIFEFKRRGGTLVLVSHDASAIERICDRAIFLWDGNVVGDGPPREVLIDYHRRLSGTPAAHPDADTTTQGVIDDPNQWGTGRARLSDLRLLCDGEPTTSVLSGQETTIAFDVEAPEPIDNPVYGVGVKTPDGLMCFGTNTDLEQRISGRLDGRQRVEITIPALNLHEGRYVLSASAMSSDLSEVYHWLENQWEFSVAPEYSGVGMVRMQFDWRIDGAPLRTTARLR